LTIASTHGRQGSIGQVCKELMGHEFRKRVAKLGPLALFRRSGLGMKSSSLDLKDFSVSKTLHPTSKDPFCDTKTLQIIKQKIEGSAERLRKTQAQI
jgi:hypothetical protein